MWRPIGFELTRAASGMEKYRTELEMDVQDPRSGRQLNLTVARKYGRTSIRIVENCILLLLILKTNRSRFNPIG